MEIWKDIAGYDGIFQISSLGRLRRNVDPLNYHTRGWTKGPEFSHQRAITRKGGGYYFYHTYYNGRAVYFDIHREVALAFIPNPENKPSVNHIDGNKHNNCVENLEWSTHKEQMAHAKMAGLMDYSESRNRKIAESRRGGHWASNGADCIFIKKNEACPEGYTLGRLLR